MSESRGLGEALGRALAAAGGDLRDWPAECPRCRSQRLTRDLYGNQSRRCEDCGAVITEAVLFDDRARRASRETGVEVRRF